jgi:uncharacterized integral membrane protein
MLLIVLFTIFVVQNTEPIVMQVFFWKIVDLPKIVLLVVTLVVGIILGILITSLFNRKKKVEVKKDELAGLNKQSVTK